MLNISKVSKLVKQYQTRQKLRCLPKHLLKDTGKTQENVNQELSKNSLLSLVTSCFRYLRKGV